MQKYLTLVFALLFSASLFAQHEPIQPFEELGIKVKVLTLSNGRYQESFPNDTTFRFGSVMFNRVTGEVVTVIENDTLYGEYNLKAEVVSRWLSPDPLAANYTSWSPYSYAIDNPISIIDPDGRSVMSVTGDYYNEKGEKIANDGKNDNKIYIIKTTQTTDELYGASAQVEKGKTNPITAEQAQSTEEALKAGKFEGDHMKNVAYAGTTGQMEKMIKAVSKDDGTGGTSAANNREYGGNILKDGKVVEAKPGGVGDPSKGIVASVSIPDIGGVGDFHSHPSGTKKVKGGTAMWGFENSQAPSNQDIKVAKSRSFVFGMRDGTIYLYDKKGVKATIPMSTFK